MAGPTRFAHWRTTNPLPRIRGHLTAARADGIPFGDAWDRALAFAADESDREAVRATEPAWRRAYNVEPATGAEQAAGGLHALLTTPSSTRNDHALVA